MSLGPIIPFTSFFPCRSRPSFWSGITLSCHVSLVFFNMEHFHRFSLSFITSTVKIYSFKTRMFLILVRSDACSWLDSCYGFKKTEFPSIPLTPVHPTGSFFASPRAMLVCFRFHTKALSSRALRAWTRLLNPIRHLLQFQNRAASFEHAGYVWGDCPPWESSFSKIKSGKLPL